jgi:EAL domain-containing protein (putative c-di-GMP-specific phosphodiesterase class I)
VEQELAATGLDAELLELEVTERVVALDNEPLRRNVARLEAAGVRFSVDDFGSGNSSLSRIGTFPVSTLKIDQSFVQVLGPQEDAAAIVSAIVSMAEQLGVECVAEGVETSQQSRVLLQRGCTTAQGFFFSPPLLPGDVERLLADAGSGSDRTIPPSALGDG